MVHWLVRNEMEEIDVHKSYGGHPTIFTISLFYGGEFTDFPGRRYVRGKHKYVDLVDIDLFSVHEIDDMMEKLMPIDEDMIRYYHFKRPSGDLDFGLFALGSDEDVNHLRSYVSEHKLIEVYTEFEQTKLHTYNMSPNTSKVRIREVVQAPSCAKRLFLTWNDTTTGDCVVKPSSVSVSGETRQVIEPIVKSPFVSEPFVDTFQWFDSPNYEPLVEANIQPLEPHDEATLQPNSDSHSEAEPLVNTQPPIQPNVEANIQSLEPHDDATLQPHIDTDSEASENEGIDDNSDSEDGDFIVDEDNALDDPEVDMRDFYTNIDKTVEWVGSIPSATEEDVPSEEEVEVIDTEILSSGSSDDEGVASRRRNKIRDVERAQRNDAALVKDPFYKYQTFSSAKEAKTKVYLHSIETRRELVFVKNDNNRVRVECSGTIPNLGILDTEGPGETTENKKKKVKAGPINKCPWVLLVSKWKKDVDWIVKTYKSQHVCLQSREIRACNYKFLSQEILDQLETNPDIPIRALREQLERKYSVNLSDMKVHRAKTKAIETIRGDFGGQYAILRDYLQEVKAKNPNTTVKIEVELEPNYAVETRVFQRVYVCLGALKRGFAACRRDLLGLDGTFIKGPYPGIVLTAVGLDGNNCTYPLAYALVEAENYNSWLWFLTNLGDDLGLYRNSNFTFISDRQKGILHAIEKLFPEAEHRFCLRHLHENMKKNWRGKEFKDCLWKCATATTVQQFSTSMEELRQLNNVAYEWLKKIPAKHWARSHFTARPHCDVLLNNMCEAMNSKLVKGRDKPIITCLEFIREYIMKKLVIVQKEVDKAKGPLTPTATKTLEKIKTEANDYRAVFCGNGKYQVTGQGTDQCVVDIKNQTCSCNKWELIGMPCKHTIACIWDMRKNSENVGIPEEWVHPTYWLSTWRDMYAFKIEPINGRLMWEKNTCPTKLLPPTYHVPIGRPKKKRRRDVLEDDGKSMSTKRKSVRCSKCGNIGHNGRSCKGQSVGGSRPRGSQVGRAAGVVIGAGKTQVGRKKGNGVGKTQGGGKKGKDPMV